MAPGGGGGSGVEGSGALAQDFASLDMGGVALGAGSASVGGGQQGFDASKDDLLGDFPCVRLRGLAADTSVKDILDFFVGLGPVLDIVLEGGSADGEIGAITLFGNLMDYHGALQRYSLQLKGRYIEVAPAVRPDYYAAVIKRSGGSTPGEATATAAGVGGAGEGNGDLQGLDGTHRGSDASPQTGGAPHAQGQAPGPASVPPSPQGPPSAVSGGVAGIGHAGAVGIAPPSAGAPAPGTQSSPSLSAQTAGVAGVHGGGAVGSGRKGGVKAGPLGAGSSKPKGLTGDGKGAVIRMRGLPYRASKSEVMGFFKGCSVPEEGIAFVTRADGRVTGEAYVRFATREDAKMGIRKDREMMGSRYIELFTSSPEEMMRYANSKR